MMKSFMGSSLDTLKSTFHLFVSKEGRLDIVRHLVY